MAATFKLGVQRAFDRLRPTFDAVARSPATPRLPASAGLVVFYLEQSLRLARGERLPSSAFDFGRHALPLDAYGADPRWGDLALALSACADVALTLPQLLLTAGDPRAGAAFVRAMPHVGFERVDRQLRHLRPKGMTATLLAAADDPGLAAHAAGLHALARALPR